MDTGSLNASVDMADTLTLGAGAVVPLNAKIYGGTFSTGLVFDSKSGGMSTSLRGYGGGAGASVGWGLPFGGLAAMGKVSPKAVAGLSPIKRKVIDTFGGTGQGVFADWLKGKIPLGQSFGSYLVAGPDTNGDLSLNDFFGTWATVCSLGANFVVNGVSAGVILFGRDKPIVTTLDIPNIMAVGAIAGVGLSSSMDIETSGIVYRMQFG